MKSIYRNKRCSKKNTRRRLGGTSRNELAYPSKDIIFSKPPLAYTGGSNACSNLYPSNLAYTPPNSTHRINRGGGCGSCSVGNLFGGTRKHRKHCRCSVCKSNKKGGNGLPYGQGLPDMNSIPYPNGLAGQPWTGNVSNWPGVDGIDGDRNYLAYNNYHNDVVTATKNVGANPPFLGGKRKLRAGDVTNTLFQDATNLGRQVEYGFGSVYNSMAGHSVSPSPLPWKDQLI